MKYIVEPLTILEFEKFIKSSKISDVLIGVENLSHGIGLRVKVDDLNKYLLGKRKSEISIKITRLFHEDELLMLKETLEKLELTKIKFIFYSDFSIYEIVKELGFSDKLVYDGYTYTTNVADVNLYGSFNKYVVVSNQISVDEIKYLTNKVNKSVIIRGFGKSIIFYSKRPLLTNYFKYRNIDNNPYDKNYYLQEEYRSDLYHLYEDSLGTYFYENKYYYLFEELKELNNVDYVILESVDLSINTYEKLIDCYLNQDLTALKTLNIELYKGIMEEKSILLKSEVTHDE